MIDAEHLEATRGSDRAAGIHEPSRIVLFMNRGRDAISAPVRAPIGDTHVLGIGAPQDSEQPGEKIRRHGAPRAHAGAKRATAKGFYGTSVMRLAPPSVPRT
jgi:hypothetical protein